MSVKWLQNDGNRLQLFKGSAQSPVQFFNPRMLKMRRWWNPSAGFFCILFFGLANWINHFWL